VVSFWVERPLLMVSFNVVTFSTGMQQLMKPHLDKLTRFAPNFIDSLFRGENWLFPANNGHRDVAVRLGWAPSVRCIQQQTSTGGTRVVTERRFAAGPSAMTLTIWDE
jgi:hypothetical protein